MRYGNNFDRLKAEALRRINAMSAGDRMSLIAFNENASMLAQASSDKNALKAAIDTLEPSFAGTRYYEAFTLADRALNQMGVRTKGARHCLGFPAQRLESFQPRERDRRPT